jgi:CO/xanthine dehydrogenase Mo-binding subunit
MPAYYHELLQSCALDRCIATGREMIGWAEKYAPRPFARQVGPHRYRGVGMSITMQGSGLSNLDSCSAEIRLGDGAYYLMSIGASDMGTGCDTILAQMVAECMDCDVEDVAVFGADTDVSPYDSGSYASSTTYVTGKAVEKACTELKDKLCVIAAEMLDCPPSAVVFQGKCVRRTDTGASVSLAEIGYRSQCNSVHAAEATASHASPVSPPPYMVGMVEIELDKLTGEVTVLDYMAVVDCGQPINPALARVQAEGGIVQGIGMALMENVTYDHRGKPIETSFMQYKLPTRLDMGHLRVEFEQSYEPTGPFGAKSIGEIVINTPSPALAHAIYRATGVWHRELPITPEQIAMSQPEA